MRRKRQPEPEVKVWVKRTFRPDDKVHIHLDYAGFDGTIVDILDDGTLLVEVQHIFWLEKSPLIQRGITVVAQVRRAIKL